MAAARYVQDDFGEGDEDRPVKVCVEAGRKCVRAIFQHAILSPEWMQLVESLRQLTRLVHLEGRMPANSKVLESAGRNKDSHGTLWDQDENENAIRILVEEAKVNLCLRMLKDFKAWQYNTEERDGTKEQAMRAYEFTSAQIEQKCKQFEECMGILLWRALTHVETLQLMDIPLLIDHCAMVLNHCQSCRTDRLEVSPNHQEVIVIRYVASLLKHAEALNNSELLARVRELRLFPLAVSHALLHAGSEYPEDLAMELCLGLASLYDNEDFNTDWITFFQGPSGVEEEQLSAFMSLKTEVVDPMLAQDPERKRTLRPLTDFFNAVSRKTGRR